MFKKLTEQEMNTILEAGVAEFAEHGPDKASMHVIAQRSGVSVGVLYKYYENKDAFFEACLRHCLAELDCVLREVLAGEDKILTRAEKLIRALQKSSKERPNYHVLYHEITAGSCRKYAAAFAREIESISSAAYAAFLSAAQAQGDIRADMDPRYFAFFFDNLLMMLQFSYSCDYYKERMKLYCGGNALIDDETMAVELLKFFESAFTVERAGIMHRA